MFFVYGAFRNEHSRQWSSTANHELLLSGRKQTENVLMLSINNCVEQVRHFIKSLIKSVLKENKSDVGFLRDIKSNCCSMTV